MLISRFIEHAKAVKKELKELPDQFFKMKGLIHRHFLRSDQNILKIGVKISFPITEYVENGLAQVRVITPKNFHCMTSFFDSDPISPNRRYLCVTKVPFISRIPVPGDIAQVCIVDLIENTLLPIYNTKGWGAQLGCNVQWLDNDHIVCNDFINAKDKAVKVNIHTLSVNEYEKPIYGLTPCKNYSYTPNLFLINAILPGYGMPESFINVKRQKFTASNSEGIWRLDLNDGSHSLFMSIEEILYSIDCESDFFKGKNYIFNVKVSDSGKYLFAVIFAKKVPFRASRVLQLVVIEIETRDVKVVVPDSIWRQGGHHPNWVKNSDTILMNLKMDYSELKFVEIDAQTGSYNVKASSIKGGGHPSISPDGDYILTDTYISEGFMDDSGLVPIRLINILNNSELELCRVYTNKMVGARRVDPHPVWSDNETIVFNGVHNNKRSVFIAKMRKK